MRHPPLLERPQRLVETKRNAPAGERLVPQAAGEPELASQPRRRELVRDRRSEVRLAQRFKLPRRADHLPPVDRETLRDYNGAVVRSSDFAEKVVLLTFLDSQCTESCPVIAAQVGRAFDVLSNAERRRIFAVAISTDPKEDTATSVRGFLRRNRALGKLHYVGGGEPESKLRRIWKRFNILSSLESGEDALHSAPVRIYEGGLWVATLHAGADLTPAILAHDLRVALRASNP